MTSIVKVTSAADSYDLVSLAAAKLDLAIADSASDAVLKTLIAQASSIVAGHCDRVFALETVEETFRFGGVYAGARGARHLLMERRAFALSRFPITAVRSVVEDGVTLDAAQYQIDTETGEMRRLSDGLDLAWTGRTVVVTYDAGYDLPDDLPPAVARATLILVRRYHTTTPRDPTIRSESIGAIRRDYAVDTASTSFSPEFASLLAPYRRTS